MSDDKIEKRGQVVAALRDDNFKVDIAYDEDDKDEQIVMAHISGKIRQNNIRIIEYDLVDVEISPYDLERGRIVRKVEEDDDQDWEQPDDEYIE